jgi:uncharacterized protein
MFMRRQQIAEQMKEAMKAKDTQKLTVLRYLWSEIKNQEIDAKRELTDEEVVTLLRREVKRRREALAQFEQGGRADLVTAEKAELVFLEVFLPQEMPAEEIEAIVTEIVAGGETNFGLIMKQVMARTGGQADGKKVSELVRKKTGL